MYDITIVGAGPAGMTAALYALRAQKKVLLLDGEGYGGQITKSRNVENYPGCANVNGMDLAEGMMAQLREMNVEWKMSSVKEIRKTDEGFEVIPARGEPIHSRTVILATGLKHRQLGVPGEETYIGRGVSFCAVCDGAMFRGREVAVIGGGNTAVGDALYLSEICSKVYLIHRRQGFRAEEELLARAKASEKIEFITDTVITEMVGEMTLNSLKLKNTVTGEARELCVAGVFEAIGQLPQNEAFSDLVACDESGYIIAGEDCKTNVEGIFAAGDCRTKAIRQLTTATADGTVASLAAIDLLG